MPKTFAPDPRLKVWVMCWIWTFRSVLFHFRQHNLHITALVFFFSFPSHWHPSLTCHLLQQRVTLTAHSMSLIDARITHCSSVIGIGDLHRYESHRISVPHRSKTSLINTRNYWLCIDARDYQITHRPKNHMPNKITASSTDLRTPLLSTNIIRSWQLSSTL